MYSGLKSFSIHILIIKTLNGQSELAFKVLFASKVAAL